MALHALRLLGEPVGTGLEGVAVRRVPGQRDRRAAAVRVIERAGRVVREDGAVH